MNLKMTKSIFRVIGTIIICCFLLTTCVPTGNIHRRTDINALSDKLWIYSHSHPEGFTVDVLTMTETVDGIAVSYSATQGCHSREKLNRVVRHALKHDGYVGGWFDSADSLYYFDSSRIFPEDSVAAAKKFGIDNGQIAIFNIGEKKEIRLP